MNKRKKYDIYVHNRHRDYALVYFFGIIFLGILLPNVDRYIINHNKIGIDSLLTIILLIIFGAATIGSYAIMAGKAALRCGLGLLKTALPKSIYPIAAGAIFESVFFPLEETPDGKISKSNIDFLLCEAEKSSAVLIGCGLSVCDDTEKLVNSFLENYTKSLVLDADALNCGA